MPCNCRPGDSFAIEREPPHAILELEMLQPAGSHRLLVEQLKLCRVEAALRGIPEGTKASDPSLLSNLKSLRDTETESCTRTLAGLADSPHVAIVLRARHLSTVLRDYNWTGNGEAALMLKAGNDYADLLQQYDSDCPPEVAQEIAHLASLPYKEVEQRSKKRDPQLNLRVRDQIRKTLALRTDSGRVSNWLLTVGELPEAKYPAFRKRHRAAAFTALKPLLDGTSELDERRRQEVIAILDVLSKTE